MSNEESPQLSMPEAAENTPPSEYEWMKPGVRAMWQRNEKESFPVVLLGAPVPSSASRVENWWVSARFLGQIEHVECEVSALRLSPAPIEDSPSDLPCAATSLPEVNGKWQIGEPFSASVIDTAMAIHGDVMGSGDTLLGDGLERAVAWLEWRVREGWHDRGMSEAVHFEEHVRSLAKAAVVLGQQALNERYAEERAEAFQRQGTTRAESGPMQFGDDWAGVFLRGDDAAAMLNWLQQLEKVADGIGMTESQLRSFARATSRFLRSKLGHGDHLHTGAGGQARNCTQMRAFAECVAPTTDKG